jgi:hypothetical protein
MFIDQKASGCWLSTLTDKAAAQSDEERVSFTYLLLPLSSASLQFHSLRQ